MNDSFLQFIFMFFCSVGIMLIVGFITGRWSFATKILAFCIVVITCIQIWIL